MGRGRQGWVQGAAVTQGPGMRSWVSGRRGRGPVPGLARGVKTPEEQRGCSCPSKPLPGLLHLHSGGDAAWPTLESGTDPGIRCQPWDPVPARGWGWARCREAASGVQ